MNSFKKLVCFVPGWLSKQRDEIGSDPILRWYGAILCWCYALGGLSWLFLEKGSLILSKGFMPYCWPFFESCFRFRYFTESQWKILIAFYTLLAIGLGTLFLKQKFYRIAYYLLFFLVFIKTLIFIQDFRLRLNQHYMLYWMTLVYLFIPAKREILKYQLILFYFWAGILKIDYEWLSGSALYNLDKFWIKGDLVPWSCLYVVILESVIIFGILFKNPYIFWSTFAQLILFHIFSWPIVQWYYPILMFLLISILPLDRLGIKKFPVQIKATRKETIFIIVLFSIFQIVPYIFPGDSALTGEGRLFALNMFDAKVQCEGKLMVHFKNGDKKEIKPRILATQRIKCDPIVFANYARISCLILKKKKSFEDLDLYLISRRFSEKEYSKRIEIEKFCTKNPSYSMLWHNDWILY